MARKREVRAVTTRPMRRLRVPAGKPPVPLTGRVTVDSLQEWGRRTREYFIRKHREWLEVDALVYFVDMYFIDSGRHPVAFEAARKALEKLPKDPDSPDIL